MTHKIFTIILITLALVTPAYMYAAAKSPLTVEIAGMKVAPDDMVKVLLAGADAVEKAAQQSRAKKENAIQAFEQQLIELGKKNDRGVIGEAEFEQSRTILVDKIHHLRQQIDTQDKAAYATGTNIQNMVMGGYNVLLENYKDEQQRKTHIAIAAASKAVENEGRIAQTKLELEASMEKLKYISDPANLKTYGLFLAGASMGIAGGYYGTKLMYRYIEQYIEKQPALALETSHKGLWERTSNSVYNLLGYPELPPTFQDNIVFSPELEEQLHTVALTTQMMHERGLPHPSLMLYGPPGTGKTWFAQLLARMSGMEYVITSADRFAQFAEGKDVEELHFLLDWAKQTKGMIIFIDEIDALGVSRDKLDVRWVRLLTAFLARTGKSCTEFKIIGATNRLNALDSAFLSRFPQKIHVPLPGQPERERLISLYLKKYITDYDNELKVDGAMTKVQLRIADDITPSVITSAASQMNGFSGRAIEQLADDMRARCNMANSPVLTKTIFDDAVREKIRQEAEIAVN